MHPAARLMLRVLTPALRQQLLNPGGLLARFWDYHVFEPDVLEELDDVCRDFPPRNRSAVIRPETWSRQTHWKTSTPLQADRGPAATLNALWTRFGYTWREPPVC